MRRILKNSLFVNIFEHKFLGRKAMSVGARFVLFISLSLQSHLSFNIGSVDNFEKNMEHVQVEKGIDPSQFIPVTYVRESEYL